MFHNSCFFVKFFDQFKIDKSLSISLISINLPSMMKVVIKRFKVSSNGNDEIRKFISQSLTVTSRVEMINTFGFADIVGVDAGGFYLIIQGQGFSYQLNLKTKNIVTYYISRYLSLGIHFQCKNVFRIQENRK